MSNVPKKKKSASSKSSGKIGEKIGVHKARAGKSTVSKLTERHARTRHDHRTETAEDYVEAVWEVIQNAGQCRVVDLADYFGVSHVTVSKTVKRLIGEGLLVSEPYQPIELTRKGSRLALVSRQRHDTIFRFLLALGVSEKVATIDSEVIEHHVSQETLDRFEAFIERHQGDGPASAD